MNQDQYLHLVDIADETQARADHYNTDCAAFSRAQGIRQGNREGLMALKEEAKKLCPVLWPRTRVAAIARGLKMQAPLAPTSAPDLYDYELDDPDPLMDEWHKDPHDETAHHDGFVEAVTKWGL